jgi:hypothetical protein
MFVFWKGNGEARIGKNRELRRTGEKVIRIPTGGMLHLSPGINEVPDAQWQAVKEHVKDDLEAGLLREESLVGRSKKPASSLADLDLQAAIKIVGECLSPETLYRWYRDDGRELVQSSVIKRCVAIEIDPPKEGLGASPEAIARAEKREAAFAAE